MVEVSNATGKGGAIRIGLGIALIAIVIAAVLGFLYVKRQGATELAGAAPPGIVHEGPLARYAKGSLTKLETWNVPRAAVATGFNDAAGKPIDLSSFRGKVVVMNLWATWCTPCVVEMPTLAAVQRKYAGADLVVVPVSVDRDKDLPGAKNFIDVHDPLLLFHDPNFALPSALKVRGLPTTVIYDRQGREVARVSGEAKWDTPEAFALFDALLKAK